MSRQKKTIFKYVKKLVIGSFWPVTNFSQDCAKVQSVSNVLSNLNDSYSDGKHYQILETDRVNPFLIALDFCLF